MNAAATATSGSPDARERPRIVVVGASGKMGRAVVRLAHEEGAFDVVGAVSCHDAGRDVGELVGVGALGVAVVPAFEHVHAAWVDAVVDFSAPAALPALAAWARARGAALVSGTTGVDGEGFAALDEAARDVPVLWEPNMSVGVLVLGELLKKAIAQLGPGFDVEIVETHHGRKVDAPSGTALRLAEVAEAALRDRQEQQPLLVHGRSGKPGARAAREVGMHAVRGGDVVGDHVVHLLGAGERLELTHRASSRDLFARGALRAAGWLVGKPPRRYRLTDVVAG